MIRLVLSDLDGTLLPFGRQVVAPEVLDAIHEMQDAGVEFGCASGRDIHDIKRIMADDERATQTFVGSNGQQLYIDGVPVEERLIPRESVLKMLGPIRKHDRVGLIIQLDTRYAVGIDADVLAKYEYLFRDDGLHLVEEPPEVDGFVKIGMPCDLPEDERDVLLAELAEAVPEVAFALVGPAWFDVMPAGTSKATAIERMVAELGISLDEVAVFGDSANDVQMFSLVPNSVAVATATPEAAAAASYRLTQPGDAAVARAFREIARAARTGISPQ